MSRKGWLVPGGKLGKEGLQRSIQYRGSLDTPGISSEELTQYDPVITWVTKHLNEKTMRGKKVHRSVVEQWSFSLANSLVPQLDHQGNARDFGSLEEWILEIKEIFPEKLKSGLPSPKTGTRQ
ncbi:hypothetical protein KBD71_05290 [Candidatus Woesebacteria bacterium]|nr:hypothetical protein [Candidatus Woesebacteria bacterium]